MVGVWSSFVDGDFVRGVKSCKDELFFGRTGFVGETGCGLSSELEEWAWPDAHFHLNVVAASGRHPQTTALREDRHRSLGPRIFPEPFHDRLSGAAWQVFVVSLALRNGAPHLQPHSLAAGEDCRGFHPDVVSFGIGQLLC